MLIVPLVVWFEPVCNCTCCVRERHCRAGAGLQLSVVSVVVPVTGSWEPMGVMVHVRPSVLVVVSCARGSFADGCGPWTWQRNQNAVILGVGCDLVMVAVRHGGPPLEVWLGCPA